MEEGQRPANGNVETVTSVLILVVMEEGQRLRFSLLLVLSLRVLILVVMEEGQRHGFSLDILCKTSCLNPCCNGRGSKTCWRSN